VTDAPSRVLLVLSEAGTGGMQAMVGLLAQGLAAADIEVNLAAGGTGDLPAEVMGVVDSGAATLHRLPSPRRAGLLRWTSGVARLASALRPDIVHGHGLRTTWPLAVATDRRRLLVTCHGLPPADLERTARLVRRTRIPIAAVGPGLAATLQAAGLDCMVIENGVRAAPAPHDRRLLAHELGIDPSAPLVVQAARLSPQKDPLTAVAAISDVPDATLLLLGGGPLVDDAEAAARRLGIEARVIVSGWRSDARSILGAADVALLSSRWEGQPLVLVEAAAAGVPIVATACPGVGDWLADGREALLAPAGDAPGLARALRRVIEVEEVRGSLVDAGRQLAGRHTLERMTTRHLEAYQSLLAR